MTASEDTSAPSDRLRERLLDAMLETAPEAGWTLAAFEKAVRKSGLSSGEAALACPNGVIDLLEALSARAARAAGERVGQADVPGMKVREKVRTGVKAYLAALEPYRAAVTRAAGSPANLLTGPKGLWSAADEIWAGLGDTSTDANWYTKRLILSGVIGSTLLVWIKADEAETDAFLDRRIEDVMKFEKMKAQVREATAKWPNPFDLALGPRK